MEYLDLNKKFHTFLYHSYDYVIHDEKLELIFHYELQSELERIPFVHRVFYYVQGNVTINYLQLAKLENFIFHIGLVETINYYKTTCPKKIAIGCGQLTKAQVDWWKKLFYHGLGEFIYLNHMATLVTVNNFVEFECIEPKAERIRETTVELVTEGHLIPVGGGKDSVVSLRVLNQSFDQNVCFVMSPPQAAYDCIKVAGYKGYLEAKRVFDPHLFKMNKEGYLNGHVPFSAILAFISLFGAALLGKKYIPLSNERSANEPSVPGTTFNHQYSKSFEFELDFNTYASNYLTSSITYFSLLRPLYEIQIGELFAKYTQFHSVYRSCNRGKVSNVWCGACPKCLFVYIILSPFLTKEQLMSQFGKDLLDEITLIPILEELIGLKETKPFECVGTVWEVRKALNMTLEKYESQEHRSLLLHYVKIKGNLLNDRRADYESGDLLSSMHKEMLEKEMNLFESLGTY
jgi:UDP-N-acetyl-alpha-D-muramoyl-L-alanyl-L-glutamate epimerase